MSARPPLASFGGRSWSTRAVCPRSNAAVMHCKRYAYALACACAQAVVGPQRLRIAHEGALQERQRLFDERGHIETAACDRQPLKRRHIRARQLRVGDRLNHVAGPP